MRRAAPGSCVLLAVNEAPAPLLVYLRPEEEEDSFLLNHPPPFDLSRRQLPAQPRATKDRTMGLKGFKPRR